VTTRLEERIGSRLIKAGPEGKGRGDRGLIDRRSYILTKGSGTGRDCLESVGNSGPERKILLTSAPNLWYRHGYRWTAILVFR
jgi:hypothetical protein